MQREFHPVLLALPGTAAAMSAAASRLARTRQAIVEQFAPPSCRRRSEEPAGWFARRKAAASTLWRYPPARLGLALATGIVSKCAGRSSWPLLALAATTGALIAVARPGPLLSVSGVLAAFASSWRVSGLLLSALATVNSPQAKPPWHKVHAS